MTTCTATPLREGLRVTVRGLVCDIIGLDSDPRALVWLVRADDRDCEVWARRDEIVAA